MNANKSFICVYLRSSAVPNSICIPLASLAVQSETLQFAGSLKCLAAFTPWGLNR